MHGVFITLAVLAPNVLMLTNPPQGVPPKAQVSKKGAFRWFELAERIGQVGVFIIPLGYALAPAAPWQWASVAVMVAALAFYYACWIRYARKRFRFRWLFEPMLGVPVPMAAAPVVYFAAASLALWSWPLAAASAIFAVGHLYVSWFTWTHVRSVPQESAAEDGEPAEEGPPASPGHSGEHE
jgi:membrane protein implicated in regulation of membrane protease activity